MNTPMTFNEILAPQKGNVIQRGIKAWINPQNPDGTIRTLKRLQVHRVNSVLRKVVADPIQALYQRYAQCSTKIHTNYTLGTDMINPKALHMLIQRKPKAERLEAFTVPQFNSVIDCATNMTTINELFHLAMGGMLIYQTLPWITSGGFGSHFRTGMDMDTAKFFMTHIVNIYLILNQRLTRARLSHTITRGLKRKDSFDPEKYGNLLGIIPPGNNNN